MPWVRVTQPSLHFLHGWFVLHCKKTLAVRSEET